MSDFFADLSSVIVAACDSIERGARVVEKRANETWNCAKTNGRIRQAKTKIEQLYREMGKISYENHGDPEKCREEQERCRAEIEKLLSEIDELRRTASERGQSAQCPNPACNNNCGCDDTFCRSCGTKL